MPSSRPKSELKAVSHGEPERGFWGFANRHPLVTLFGITWSLASIADIFIGKPREPLFSFKVGPSQPDRSLGCNDKRR